jgi:hypothetical protein
MDLLFYSIPCLPLSTTDRNTVHVPYPSHVLLHVRATILFEAAGGTSIYIAEYSVSLADSSKLR